MKNKIKIKCQSIPSIVMPAILVSIFVLGMFLICLFVVLTRNTSELFKIFISTSWALTFLLQYKSWKIVIEMIKSELSFRKYATKQLSEFTEEIQKIIDMLKSIE